ncbi:MAG TPA: BrnT family toxin [Gemmataceae bacterium]|nr:BrnT family toxin [Gemmataceae bacterium]
MMLHDNFEWDDDKAKRNLKKHGVSFDDAALVLSDEDGDKFHVEEFDRQHSAGEDRYVTTASHPENRGIVLIVAWTDRSTDDAKITRIISARAASPAERKKYVKEIGSH